MRGNGRGGIPWGLLGMLVLVAAAETFVSRRADHFADFAAQDWGVSRRRAAREAVGAKVLCFGDSQVKMGVVPRVIEARTGLRAYNLALVGGQPASSYALLKRAMGSGARPEAVVVDFLPPLLAMDLERNRRNYPELLSVRESAELAWEEGDAGALAWRTLAMGVPSVKSRVDLRRGLMGAFRGRWDAEIGDPSYRRNWRANLGAMLFPHYPFGENPEAWYRANYPGPWACTPLHEAYVRRFLGLAASRNIKVFWLLHPIAPAARGLCEERGQDARYERFVRETAGRYANVVVVDGRHAGYGNSEFIDTVHLHARASAVLSEGLAGVIGRGNRHGERWVKLSEYRAGGARVRLETLEESRLALKVPGVARR